MQNDAMKKEGFVYRGLPLKAEIPFQGKELADRFHCVAAGRKCLGSPKVLFTGK